MGDEVKILFWTMAGPGEPGGEPWADRLPTAGEILKSDTYDFILLPGVSAPEGGRQGSMLADIITYMPGFSYCYTRHIPDSQTSTGLLFAYRHEAWEADMQAGFRVWPPNTDRALFCVLFHELGDDKKRTGRALYLALSQFRDDADLDYMREAMAMVMVHELAQRPQPATPVVWAGDLGLGGPSPIYGYATGHPADLACYKNTAPDMPFRDPLAMLHPERAAAATFSNWRDYEPGGGGGPRRDFIFLSEGLTPHSLDFNYMRTPGGLFPSNHFPQRLVMSLDQKAPGAPLN